MSWMSQLYQTYEENIENSQQSELSLTPIAHINANAHIEITLNQEGEFINAKEVKKENAVTLIPVTEASAGRSSGIAPHPLCDTLSYLAGDFSQYCEKEKEKKTSEEKYQKYIEQLKRWVLSPYTHPKVQAIFQYLTKKQIIKDLLAENLVSLTEKQIFDTKKINGQSYDKMFVRFRVLDENFGTDGTWQDASLITSYTQYYLQGQSGKTDICYLMGEEKVISENHPKGIIAANYGAKLVSANDGQGYTYRGRFLDAGQAYTLSYEASQKIHSALTWLVKKQGAFIGTQDKRTFICWNPKGKKVPDIFGELGLEDDEELYTDIPYRKKLIKTFQGYQNQFEDTDSVIIMGVDAATTGRLSVTYYQELAASYFLKRVIDWGNTCCWFYLKFDEQKRPYYKVETPILRRIVECAFGRERKNFIEADDKVLKEQTQRLVKCMLEGERVPLDIVHALTIRASTPQAYTRNNWEKVLSTACALIYKYHYEHSKESQEGKEDMKLDLENQDRSYLFGRLLAVCEKVERITYERGENREPNAIRLQSAYVHHPMNTWKILNDLLRPYFQKLHPVVRENYQNLIAEIVTSFQEEDEKNMNLELKETYLLGYYLQRAELIKNKKDKKEEQEDEQLAK